MVKEQHYILGILGKPTVINGEIARTLIDCTIFKSIEGVDTYLKQKEIIFSNTPEPTALLSSMQGIVPQLMLVVYRCDEDGECKASPYVKWGRFKRDSMDN